MYLFICIILLAILCVPTVYYFDYDNSILVFPGFGLHFEFYIDSSQTPDFHFMFISLISDLILTGALILLIILLILCNNLRKGGILGIGIPCTILLLISLTYYTFIDIIDFLIFDSRMLFRTNYDYYMFGLIITLVVLGLFMILKERRVPHANVNESNTSEIMKLKTNQTLEHQIIRLSYLIISGSLIFLLFFPYRFEYSSYSNIIYTTFFYGLVTRFDLDTLGFLLPMGDPYTLIMSIPLIAATILLIILLVLYKKLNKGGLLGLGIPCALLMITSPILVSVINLLELPSFYFGSFYYYMPSLSAGIVVLGLIKKVKDLKKSNIGKSKTVSQIKDENKQKQQICSQCGAEIRSDARFCIECGKEIKIIEKSIF